MYCIVAVHVYSCTKILDFTFSDEDKDQLAMASFVSKAPEFNGNMNKWELYLCCQWHRYRSREQSFSASAATQSISS